MNRFLIVNTNVQFYQDMSLRIEIDEDEDIDVDLLLYKENEELQSKAASGNYTAIILCSNVVEREDFKTIPNQKIFGFLEKKTSDSSIFSEYNIKNIGYFKKNELLLDYLSDNIDLDSQPVTPKDVNSVASTSFKEAVQEPVKKVEETPVQEETLVQENIEKPKRKKRDLFEKAEAEKAELKKQESVPEVKEAPMPAPGKLLFCSNCGAKMPAGVKFCSSCGSKIELAVTDDIAENMRDAATERDDDPSRINALVEKDIRPAKHVCKVITTYAAKGGVGKTTLASNLAVYLAMTSTDRRMTKVCVVDFNIDFGDIRATLGFSSKEVNMMTWASDINSRLEDGENPKEIVYTQKEIEDNYLQKKSFDKTVYNNQISIYGLIAPISHSDSMLINEDAFDIMLTNLIKNGDFDYIICDTGNNTRDSSYAALKQANNVLLINTQDVTTVSCNDSFLKTMQMLEFDTNKIFLVINDIFPAKETGVSVKDIEETVPFDCVARIKHDSKIKLANNKGIPAVFDSGSQFTKEVINIVSAISDEELTVQPKKKGLFGGFKKKK